MIRPAGTSDAKALQQIFVTSLGYATTECDVVRRRIDALSGDPRCISLVWADDDTDRVRGFIHALRYDTLHNEGGWDAISLAVEPTSQGHGIGQALLAACEATAARRGGSFIRLNSSMARTDAHGFYEHLGYTSNKVQKHFTKRLS